MGRDYNKAREWYEKAAAQGNAGVQNDLGLMYKDGRGLAQDYGKARTLLEKASAHGDVKAYRNLRVLYTKNWSVVQKIANRRF